MRILVTGATGLLGTAVTAEGRARGLDMIALGQADLDVTDAPSVARVVTEAGPEAVIHCAAYTAVDRAESEPRLARLVNVDGTRHVAEAAAEAGAVLVYVSTDYVFDGRKRTPYLPEDRPGPLGVYGRTKLDGEGAAVSSGGEVLIARTSWLYGLGSGFVPAILAAARAGRALQIVEDQRGRPTWAPHAAAAILDLLQADARGLWHVAGGGETTWLELAREALRTDGTEVEVVPVSTEAYGAPAPRPAYSVLDLTATESRLGRRMPHWREGLSGFFEAEAAAVTRR